MKIKMTGVMIVLVLAALAIVGVGAEGVNPAQLSSAGWICFNAGPNNWVHCNPPGTGATTATMTVRVFDTEDVNATEAEFLGTESLIHADIYHGQPCPQDNLETYEDLMPLIGIPYYACHHFYTAHH